jgi:hypothetical protein
MVMCVWSLSKFCPDGMKKLQTIQGWIVRARQRQVQMLSGEMYFKYRYKTFPEIKFQKYEPTILKNHKIHWKPSHHE